METFSTEVFDANTLATKYQELAALIGPYASQESGEEAFTAAVEQLTANTATRAEEVSAFLDTQE